MKPIRVIELFAGIGAQHQALKQCGVPHEVVAISEIDTKASETYKAIHGDVDNLGDITKIEHLPECDLLTYSFPCQDLSFAGKKRGMSRDSGTRSSLLWEVERLLDDYNQRGCLPEVLMMENVSAILSKKNLKDFNVWLEKLSSLGYISSYKVLNATDYGVAQRRERCFMISMLNGKEFQFPDPFPLEKRLKDYLEDDVDVSYYLNKEQKDSYVSHDKKQAEKGNGFKTRYITLDDKVCPTLTTVQHKNGPLLIMTGKVMYTVFESGQRVYSPEGICPTLTTKDKFTKVILDEDEPVIRFLTPRECYRLMGFPDEAFDKAESINSKTGLYKQAGNSIVVDVLVAIFNALYKDEHPMRKNIDDWE
jgi:DNA (cytosine-5)-methyltransferase 1